jgi:hypothetical protein
LSTGFAWFHYWHLKDASRVPCGLLASPEAVFVSFTQVSSPKPAVQFLDKIRHFADFSGFSAA